MSTDRYSVNAEQSRRTYGRHTTQVGKTICKLIKETHHHGEVKAYVTDGIQPPGLRATVDELATMFRPLSSTHHNWNRLQHMSVTFIKQAYQSLEEHYHKNIERMARTLRERQATFHNWVEAWE